LYVNISKQNRHGKPETWLGENKGSRCPGEKQEQNVIAEFPKVARDLRNKLQEHLKIEIPPLPL